MAACLSRPISWSMAAMLRVSVAVVGRARLRSTPIAMLTVRKELHCFLFRCMLVVLFLWIWYSAWPSFEPPELHYKFVTNGRYALLFLLLYVHWKTITI